MTRLRYPLASFIGACLIAFCGAAILGRHMDAEAQPTALYPFTTVTSVTTGAAIQIGGINPSRRSYIICDGSAAGGIFILPNLNPAGAQVLPTTASGIFVAASTCFTPPANLMVQGSAVAGGQAWNAIAVSNTSVVTFTEW